ncbi:P-loop containing nucleoside triphosphate hydrolase protein [Lasiosphaeria ovina]|uniref:P-loop containing nucleoside triphosphate hydrolase protein n=1 Tax=Lasiosphaeria ovina TaxID=92902 RepID=A0AAE0N8L6_9PEZI|nr:P-loop containing nucleoside triphosphate hydrolase protein [Lasiosphaeria ovina]
MVQGPRTVRKKGTDVKYGLKNLAADTNGAYALVLERTFDDKNTLEKATLQINSPHLLSILRSTVKYYPAVPADFNVAFQMESPFQLLFHYWDELHAAAERDDLSDEARMHLKLLLGFMQADLGPSKERVESMLKAGSIGFSTLWTIFRPGSLVYAEVDGHQWILRLEKTAYEESTRIGKYVEVHCRYTDYDGQSHGQTTRVFQIRQKRLFAAENPCGITSLPVYPLDWYPDGEALQDQLAERGERYLAMNGILVKAYNGLARYLKDPPYGFYDPDMESFAGVWLPYTETGRIVLDQKTFKEENYFEGVSVSANDAHSRSERMLCPPYLYGYSLALKDWCRFYIDGISEISWNESALDTMVLSQERKSLLKALVLCHDFKDQARDEAKQKGKGLVMLLHGSPGSGKTLTAESAAEATKRALLTATIGELNRDDIPSRFERRLKQVLQYATIWKAVVLLDEADVFLEGRSEAAGVATEHNALVAVFLKHLEYFSGIVFLTSNRVVVFDKAMKSRIHLALEYLPPTIDMRRRIWSQYLGAVAPGDSEIDIEEDVDQFLRDELNGREIANCVSTARTLARFNNVKLAVAHVETVLASRREFENSLTRIRAKRQKGDGAKTGSFQLARRDTLETTDE